MNIHGLLVDSVIFLHLVWILFLIFGFVFALKKSWIAFLHMAGLLFTLLLNLTDYYCPLTYLENYLRVLNKSTAAYSGGFIYNYLYNIIYPDLPELYIRIFSLAFVALYVIGYAILAKRYHILTRLRCD